MPPTPSLPTSLFRTCSFSTMKHCTQAKKKGIGKHLASHVGAAGSCDFGNLFHPSQVVAQVAQCVCQQCGRPVSSPWVGKTPRRRKWQPTPGLLPGESHGRRSLVGYSPWGGKESGTTELLHFPSILHSHYVEVR